MLYTCEWAYSRLPTVTNNTLDDICGVGGNESWKKVVSPKMDSPMVEMRMIVPQPVKNRSTLFSLLWVYSMLNKTNKNRYCKMRRALSLFPTLLCSYSSKRARCYDVGCCYSSIKTVFYWQPLAVPHCTHTYLKWPLM